MKFFLFSICFFFIFSPLATVAESIDDYRTELNTAATAEGIPPAFLAAIVNNESGFNPNKISGTGCAGLGQVCKTSADINIIKTQCNQSGGPNKCDKTSCSIDGQVNWCSQTCPINSNDSNCVPDDRFDPAKNLLVAAKILKAKITRVERAGCDISTAAAIKSATFAYNMGNGRIDPAINSVGCSSFEDIYAEIERNFAPINCADTPCTSKSNTSCGSYDGFTGSNLCLRNNELQGKLYTNGTISIEKLKRKSNEPGTYVTNIFEDYQNFGGNASAPISSGNGAGGGPITIRVPELLVNIPGLSFSTNTDDFVITHADGSKSIIIPFLGEYISAIYRLSIGIFIIATALVIIFSGIQMMSPGNLVTSGEGDQQQTVNQAKKRIIGAFAGLLLALSAYVILVTINPDLVKLNSLTVPYVQSTNSDSAQANYTAGTFDGNITRPTWNENTYVCKPESSRPPAAGVMPASMVEKITCPVGLTGRDLVAIPAMKNAICKAAQLAHDKGYELSIISSYRSYERQANNWCNSERPLTTRRSYIALPGFSNHGHGVALDVTLIENGSPLWGTNGNTQCAVSPTKIRAIAEIFYEADSNFVRYENEIWHFEYGTASQAQRGKYTGKPNKCS